MFALRCSSSSALHRVGHTSSPCRRQPAPRSTAARMRVQAAEPSSRVQQTRRYEGLRQLPESARELVVEDFQVQLARDVAKFPDRGHWDYDFSNLAWINSVEKDYGWQAFWRDLDNILFDDPPQPEPPAIPHDDDATPEAIAEAKYNAYHHSDPLFVDLPPPLDKKELTDIENARTMRLYRQQFGWQAYFIQGRELPAITWGELEEEAQVVLEKDANGEKVLKLDAEDDDADIDWGDSDDEDDAEEGGAPEGDASGKSKKTQLTKPQRHRALRVIERAKLEKALAVEDAWEAAAAHLAQTPDPQGRRMRMSRQAKAAAVMEAQSQLTYAPTPRFVNPVIETQPAGVAPPMQPAYRKREADLDEWTLRAKREKALMHEERNLFWEDDQISRWQPDTINLTELNDSRAVREWRGEQQEWTHEQMWDLITNNGQSVDPWIVRDSPIYKEQNPNETWDWADQGITVVEDWDEWLEGHVWQEKDMQEAEASGALISSDGEEEEEDSEESANRPAELSGEDAEQALAALFTSNAAEE